MIWVLAVVMGVAVAAGTYLALSRDLFRMVVGLSVIGAALNLLVFAAGRLGASAPPIVAAGRQTLEQAANPLPQALVLTAIVIGFALLCFSLVLAVRVLRRDGADDLRTLRAAEPPHGAGYKPAVEEES
jgi:multicomponent Na+:H+ antiporter subunit C